eukprot:PITA_32190
MKGRLNFCTVISLSFFLVFCEPKLTYAEINATKPLVSAFYMFGDSTVDPGNNNVLKTLAKANFRPYGRDFVDHKPTGRFSNGKLVSDILSGLLGLPDILPAYLDPEFNGSRILTGASFASSAAGLDDSTSRILNVLTLWQQLKNFRLYKDKLVDLVGTQNATDIISKALFAISMGTDDFTNNYYLDPLTRLRYTVTEYQDHLLGHLSKFIQNIYEEGATIFALIGLPSFGCLPSQITLHNLTGGACVDEFNDVAISFDQKCASLLETLKPTLPGFKMGYVNIYNTFFDILKNPRNYGFEEARRGCCGTGLLEASIGCNPITVICQDPSKYVFWDSFHPTEHAYNIVAQNVFPQVVSILQL